MAVVGLCDVFTRRIGRSCSQRGGVLLEDKKQPGNQAESPKDIRSRSPLGCHRWETDEWFHLVADQAYCGSRDAQKLHSLPTGASIARVLSPYERMGSACR